MKISGQSVVAGAELNCQPDALVHVATADHRGVEDLSILKIVVTNVEVEAIMHEIAHCTAEDVDGTILYVLFLRLTQISRNTASNAQFKLLRICLIFCLNQQILYYWCS